MTRICKTEKFIPRNGNPVFQIQEEADLNGVVQLLPPRNPTAEELTDADDVFAAAQQAIITEKTARIADLESQLQAATATIERLKQEVPYDVRVIDATAFLERVSKAELMTLFGSTDPILQQIATMLTEYKANDWPVMLDSHEMGQAVGYLVQSSTITSERAAQLLADVSRAEAYVFDGKRA